MNTDLAQVSQTLLAISHGNVKAGENSCTMPHFTTHPLGEIREMFGEIPLFESNHGVRRVHCLVGQTAQSATLL